MLYFDTSFIAPYILPENTSLKIQKFMRSLHNEELAVSHWTKTEFTSLIARQVRMHELNKHNADLVLDKFEDIVNSSFNILTPTINDFSLASSFIKKYETHLKAGDALHLAIARNYSIKHFYTLDKTLLNAAKLLQISVGDF